MDQKTSNDADKRNWRERLGIGTKDLPRIADEFARPKEPVLMEQSSKPKAAPIVVAKPAPMAPRVPPKPVERPVPQPQVAAAPGRPMQPSPPQQPDVLAERLRNQRIAAEKLAEQRVTAAKERAEANKVQAAQTAPQPQANAAAPQGAAKGKPKFTFSEEELRAEPKRDNRSAPPPPTRPQPSRPMVQQPMQPQLTPPRPALGGERPIVPQGQQTPQGPQPSVAGLPPQFRPTQGYRPIDPATGYVPPPAFQPARNSPFSGMGPKPPAPDPRARPRAMPESYGAEPIAEPAMRMPRYEPPARPQARGEPLRPPTYNFDDDYQDEIFEEPAQPTRRASATDYTHAYRDQDGLFEPERRKSGGPWLLLALLLLAAAAAGGGIWYYQTQVKTGATTAATGDAPVIDAPATPPKTTPEEAPAAAGQNNTSAASLNKKQIYDRIVGDREVPGGAVTPTEEAPVQPVVQDPPQPAQGAAQPSTGQSEDNLPLPMPPPPGGNTQGAMPAPAGNSQLATSTATSPGAAEAIPQPDAGQTTMQQAAASPAAVTEEISDQPADAAPAAQEAIVDEPAPAAVKKKPAKSQQAAKAKPKPKAKAEDETGAQPVVLVPPADGEAATQDPSVGEPPLVTDGATTPAPAPAKKKKTLLGLFTGENSRAEEAPAAETQVAAVQPEAQTAPPAQRAQAAKSGFVVQLSSFRSEREAKAEASRMASKHAGIFNGLSPGVSAVSVGGSTRYRVVFGTMESRTQAANVCQQLASSGERDCVIARR